MKLVNNQVWDMVRNMAWPQVVNHPLALSRVQIRVQQHVRDRTWDRVQEPVGTQVGWRVMEQVKHNEAS